MVRQERDERYASTVSATSIDSDRPLIYKLFPRFFPFLLHRFAYRSWRARARIQPRLFTADYAELNNSLPRYFIEFRGPRAISPRFMARDRPDRPASRSFHLESTSYVNRGWTRIGNPRRICMPLETKRSLPHAACIKNGWRNKSVVRGIRSSPRNERSHRLFLSHNARARIIRSIKSGHLLDRYLVRFIGYSEAYVNAWDGDA